MNRIIKSIFKAILSSITLYFHFNILSFDRFCISLNSIVVELLILLLAFFFFYYSHVNSVQTETIIASFLFSLFLCVDYAYNEFGTILYSKIGYYVFYLFYYIGWFFLFTGIIFYLRKTVNYLKNKNVKKIDRYLNDISDRKYTFVSMIIILISWMPYIILRFPAGIEYDGMHQLLQYFGYEKLTNHWPVFSTYLMGFIANIGKIVFGSYDFGVLFLVIVQCIFASFTFSYTILYGKKHGLSSLLQLFILCVYSFVPIFPGYFTSIVKDVPYSLALLWLVIFCAKTFIDENSNCISLLFISAFFVSLLRNEGTYVIVILSIFFLCRLLIYKQSKCLLITIVLSINIVISLFYSNVLLPEFGIKGTSISEALSIPFQQTARYLNVFNDELSEEEKEVIGNVLNINVLRNEYNPLLSDPVKATYHGDNESLSEYLLTWSKMFFKHPMTYIDATLNNSYGFFYSTKKVASGINSGVYDFDLVLENEESGKQVSLYSIGRSDYLTGLIRRIVKKIENIPIFGQICNIGLYICATIYMSIYSFRYKKEKLLLFVPSFICLAVCVASPTWWWNGFRYALPIVTCFPFLLINMVI